jgi:endonuclease/exonuclease/phosphatase family metal-dependent hydrolase
VKKPSLIVSRLIFAVNVLVAGLLLITCILSFLTIKIAPLLSVLSLFVPVLFIINALFLGYWLLMRKRKLLLSLITLLIGYIVFGPFFGIGNHIEETTTSDLKIMTYNVWGFNKNEWIKEPNVGDRIIEFIKKENPDVLCIQEHDRIRYKQLSQYPYRSETPYSVPRTIQAIFSKYPIIGNGSLDLPGTTNNIIFADILYEKDTIRVYNLHLQSYNIVPSSETFSEEESERNYKRLVNTFAKQLEQAKIFNEHKKTSPFKNIVCGDMNNTQFSNVYRILSTDLQDTFLEKGSGFGLTYDLLGFPIRIDFIFSDPAFEVVSHKNYDEKLSDHYPVMAALRLKSD